MTATLQLFKDGAGWRWRLEDLGATVAAGRARSRDLARADGNRARRDYLASGCRPGTLSIRIRDFDAAVSGGTLHVPATVSALATTAAAWGNGRRLVLAAFDTEASAFRRAAVTLTSFRVIQCRCGGRRGRGCRACDGGRVLRLSLSPDATTPKPGSNS